MYFVDVILPLAVKGVYTYSLPNHFTKIDVGFRVIVHFGSKKLYSAIVVKIHDNEPKNYIAKEVLEIIDVIPIVNQHQIDLWYWISNYYCCTLGEVMSAALPSSLKLSSQSKVQKKQTDFVNQELSDSEFLVMEALALNEYLSYNDIEDILQKKSIFKTLKSLLDRDCIEVIEELNQKYSEKTLQIIRLKTNFQFNKTDFKNAKKQYEVLNYLKSVEKSNEHLLVIDLLKKTNASRTTIKTLEKKGIVDIETVAISRIVKHIEKKYDFPVLSKSQKLSLQQIKNSFVENNVVLFHGVTSSGKTEIYVKLIEESIKNDQQVLYLLPEIALTTQIINRLRKYFGDKVGVYHSKYNNNERTELWIDLLNKKRYSIIVGTRSSIFLPFSNLGLIIVDEEHESNFKQQAPAPRYNARDAVVRYASSFNARVLLGSATPSLESYYNVEKGKYGLVSLNERYGGVDLPEIEIVDIKYVHHRKMMKGSFSPQLLKEIEFNLENNKQIIIFQNRRGFTPLQECHSCGWTSKCNSCDVSLTFHKNINLLKCHYCGYTEKPINKCKLCHSSEIKHKGFGTEKIEEELSVHFPKTNIKRLDLDTTSRKNSFQQILNDFQNRKIDILVGTQMVTKGLDFDNVGLVGVLNADNLLNFPDFRAHERTFQMLLQVAGRAGRKDKNGKVLIQTFSADHEVIKAVKKHDYYSNIRYEIRERKLFNYPPFNKLIKVTISHVSFELTAFAAKEFATILRQSFRHQVLGPEFPPVSKVKNRHIKCILLKVQDELPHKQVREYIASLVESFKTSSKYRSLRISIDIDPY